MPTKYPLGQDPTIGRLSPERTKFLEAALPNGWPLHGLCPHPACTTCEAVTTDTDSPGEQLIVQLHPCGHRYWPQWVTPAWEPSRFLTDPASRDRRRWWQRLR